MKGAKSLSRSCNANSTPCCKPEPKFRWVASKVPYSAEEIDFLVTCIFPEDAWYVFPVALVENRKLISITPGGKRSPFKQYREAWNLMRPAEPETVQAVADDTLARASGYLT
jgi:hypothetical protein